MGKPLDSPAYFRSISLTSCVLKLFERFIVSHLLFLKFSSILSPHQTGFCPWQSTIKFCPFLSPFRIGLTYPIGLLDNPCYDQLLESFRLCLAPLFHKLILAGLPFCFACWTQSFLSDRRACVVYQNHKSRSSWVHRDLQGSVLGPVLFSLFINDLWASLPSSLKGSLYGDNLAIWPSSPSVPIVVEATQGALSQLERWSEHWCLPCNPSKCETSFFLVDCHQAPFQPHLLLLNSLLRFNPTPIFLGVTFDCTFSFLNMYLCWKPSSSLVSPMLHLNDFLC